MTDENDYPLTVLIVILAAWTVAYIFFGMKMIATNEHENTPEQPLERTAQND